jgi:hypothetical protein
VPASFRLGSLRLGEPAHDADAPAWLAYLDSRSVFSKEPSISTMPPPSSISLLLGDDRAAIEEQYTDKYAGFVIVDGKLHCACAEPVLRHEYEASQVRTWVSIDDRRYRNPYAGSTTRGLNEVQFFAMTEGAELRAYSESLDRRKILSELVLFEAINILDPSVFVFDRYAEAHARTVGQGIWEYEREIADMSYQAARDFLDLREVYRRWLVDPSSVDPVALLEEAERVLSSDGVPRGQKYVDFMQNRARAAAMPPRIAVAAGLGL